MPDRGRQGVRIGLGALLLIGSAAISVGAAKRELTGKEDREAHLLDLRDLRDTIRDVQAKRREQAIRDSAFRADVIRRLDDISCVVRHRGACE